MQLLSCIVPLLATSAFAAPANAIAWRPHEFDDIQNFVATEGESLRKAQGTKASKLVLASRGKPAVHLARHVATIDRELANPALGDYLGMKRPAGKEFSTQWNTKPWNEVAGHASPHSLAWHPVDDLVDQKTRAKKPSALLVPYSRLLSEEMKDAVVLAESLKADTEAGSSPARAVRAATAWGPAPKRSSEGRTVLAESRLAAKATGENPYTATLGVSQEITAKAANPYEAYLASDKDRFMAFVHREEARADHLEQKTKTSVYADEVVPVTVGLISAGH